MADGVWSRLAEEGFAVRGDARPLLLAAAGVSAAAAAGPDDDGEVMAALQRAFLDVRGAGAAGEAACLVLVFDAVVASSAGNYAALSRCSSLVLHLCPSPTPRAQLDIRRTGDRVFDASAFTRVDETVLAGPAVVQVASVTTVTAPGVDRCVAPAACWRWLQPQPLQPCKTTRAHLRPLLCAAQPPAHCPLRAGATCW
jgi:hypothetical protein